LRCPIDEVTPAISLSVCLRWGVLATGRAGGFPISIPQGPDPMARARRPWRGAGGGGGSQCAWIELNVPVEHRIADAKADRMIVAGLRFGKFRRNQSRRACRRGADSSGRAADNSPSFTRVSGEIEGLTQLLHPAAGPNGWSYAGDWVTRSIRRRGEPAF
jgi:hypothetical protein